MEAQDATEDRPSHLRIYLIVIAASTLHLSTGAIVGWSSPILPKLNLTAHEQGMVTSLYYFGAAPGPFITTFCIDTIGRKGALYVVWLFFMASWGILLMSQNVYLICIARIIGGIGYGGAYAALPVYVAEVAIAKIRGRLGAASMMISSVGALLMFCVGPYVTYSTVSIYGSGMAILFVLIFFFVPESPFYHVSRGRIEEGKAALQKLRGYRTREKLEEELEEIENTITQKSEKNVGCMEGMKHPAAFKVIGLSLFLVSMTYFSGTIVQGAYAETIYSSLHLSFSASYMGVVNIAAQIIFLFLPVLLVNKCVGMKTGIIISGYISGLTCVFLGIYFYCASAGYDLYDYSYLAIVLSVANSFGYSLGLGSLIATMVVELMPMSLKGIGIGIVGFISSLLGFGVLNLFPVVAHAYGYHPIFFGMAIIMFILSTLAVFILPDTTGKTLQEIEELLK